MTCHEAQAHVSDFSLLPSRSGVMRPYDQRIVLDVLTKHMVVISVSGFLFFGSSLAVSDKVLSVRAAPSAPAVPLLAVSTGGTAAVRPVSASRQSP